MSAPIQRKSAVLIIHAPCTDVVTWQNFTFLLGTCGYAVKCPRLPSSSLDADVADKGLKEEVEVVQATLRDFMNKGYSIVVIAHSQGGAVASESVSPEFYYSSETGVGVKHIIFVCAYLPLPGSSAGEIFDKNPTGTKCEFAWENGTVRPINPAGSFCNDLPLEQAKLIVKDNTNASAKTFWDKISRVPWKDLPCSYVFTNRDQAILLWLQKQMVEEATAAGGKFETYHINSGHGPHISKQNELFAIFRRTLES